jgi:hypothetical protein
VSAPVGQHPASQQSNLFFMLRLLPGRVLGFAGRFFSSGISSGTKNTTSLQRKKLFDLPINWNVSRLKIRENM